MADCTPICMTQCCCIYAEYMFVFMCVCKCYCFDRVIPVTMLTMHSLSWMWAANFHRFVVPQNFVATQNHIIH